MNQAIGLVEVAGLASAIKVADTMLKAANVNFKTMEKTRGNGWMVIIIEGDVGAVNASVNSGEADAKQFGKFVSSKVIPRPVDGLSGLLTERPSASSKKEAETKKPRAEKSEDQASSASKEAAPKASAKKADTKKSAVKTENKAETTNTKEVQTQAEVK